MPDTMTCAQLVSRVQRRVAGARNATLNRLTVAVDDEVVELVVDFDPGPIARQTFVALDNEMCFVWEVDRGAKTLTVERGALGTEAAAHDLGAIVEVGARFPRAVIRDAIQDEIRSWPEDVFRVKAVTLSSTTWGQGGYDLGIRDESLRFVLEALRSPLRNIAGQRWSRVDFTVERGMDRVAYPSGCALFITDRNARSGGTVRIMAAIGFEVDDISDDDDVIDDWGLSRSMVDIVSLGTAARLLQDAEAVRTDTESLGESRLAAEVPPTYLTNTATALRRMADTRIRQEAMRLRSRYPMPS